MAGELATRSSDRNGARVPWATIHTAEGAWDEFPSRPDLDAGSARDLLAFGLSVRDRSWHACCDDDELLDQLVPYDRAAWTLRDGNRFSDNLEMCGLASWSRAEWLAHLPMLRLAARWVAGRLKARGLPDHRLTDAEVAAGTAGGYMDHATYTRARRDGTHTDVGRDFPWDVFGQLVTAAYNGQPLDATEDDPMAGITLEQIEAAAERGARNALNAGTPVGSRSWADSYSGLVGNVQRLINMGNQAAAEDRADAGRDAALAAAIPDLKSAILAAIALDDDTAGWSDEQRAQLADDIAGRVAASPLTVHIDPAEVLDAAAARLTA